MSVLLNTCCGVGPEVASLWADDDMWGVYCPKCKQGVVAYGQMKARGLWNTRQAGAEGEIITAARELRKLVGEYGDGNPQVPWVVVRDALAEFCNALDESPATGEEREGVGVDFP